MAWGSSARPSPDPAAVIQRYIFITSIQSLYSLHLTSQGKGKKYRLGEIYEDDSKCPPVDYKCKRIRGMRNLDWEQMGSGNFFEGMYINIFLCIHVYDGLKVVPLYRRVVTTALKYLMTIMFSPW